MISTVNGEKLIEVTSVSKHFGSIRALKDVSFHMGRGEIAGLLGRNGAGKTTMLRLLAGFFTPSEGQIKIAGLNLETDSLAVKGKIGCFLEKSPVYPEMRVVEFLEFVAKLKGVSRALRRKAIADVIESCGLGEVRYRMVGNLSKGYRQRVGLSQSLLGNPEVLLLDEPTSGLDPEQIIEIRDLIKGLASRTTVLLSTHILSEASQICNKIIILDKGSIVATDTLQRLNTLLHRGPALFSTQIESAAGQVAERLNEISGIIRVQLGKMVSPYISNYLIEAAAEVDLPAELCALAFKNRWILREMQPVNKSLEEIFVELTTKEKLQP